MITLLHMKIVLSLVTASAGYQLLKIVFTIHSSVSVLFRLVWDISMSYLCLPACLVPHIFWEAVGSNLQVLVQATSHCQSGGLINTTSLPMRPKWKTWPVSVFQTRQPSGDAIASRSRACMPSIWEYRWPMGRSFLFQLVCPLWQSYILCIAPAYLFLPWNPIESGNQGSLLLWEAWQWLSFPWIWENPLSAAPHSQRLLYILIVLGRAIRINKGIEILQGVMNHAGEICLMLLLLFSEDPTCWGWTASVLPVQMRCHKYWLA